MDHGVDLGQGIRSRPWHYIMAPDQDRPITLKVILADERGGEVLNTPAMRDEGRHRIVVISTKVIPQRLIGDGTLNPFAIDAG